MRTDSFEVCVVGAGPRGLSFLERLCANVRAHRPDAPVTVHMVDPDRPGAGRMWRTDQSPLLLTHSAATRTTLFAEDGVRMDGPREPGPTLYEWARFLTLMGPLEHAPEYDAATLAQARGLRPGRYAPRALYGHYLEWAFARVVRRAPAGVTVRVHRSRAVALDDSAGSPHQEVLLEDGTLLGGLHTVVLTQDHLPARMSAAEEELAVHAVDRGLTYVPPANPADLDLSRLAGPGQTVLLRGLGHAFLDHLTLLTEGRGGTYERTGRGLVYRPGGREPVLYAGSRCGVPHRAHGGHGQGPDGHRPCRTGEFTGPRDFTRWLLGHLRDGVRSTLPRSAGGASDAAHRRSEPVHAHPSPDPPVHRVEQMIALIEAGVLHVTGPGTRVTTGPDCFVLESAVPGARTAGRVLIEARHPDPDLRRTADPLLRRLLDTGRCRPLRVASADGSSHETGSLDVTDPPSRPVDAAGRPHPRRFVHRGAGIRPGTDLVTPRDWDVVARAVLDLCPDPGARAAAAPSCLAGVES
ncbi:FAD/NAD(P)-binding domain-containing protein [Streptomyces sp. B1I3]|uniref:FAD/NAD(P)-binding protein n=1 Tax=Streptomyces sp. B1I3 TaxID=3042264 RepID=UPI0027803691|nr:FAD/NAD(P)-binding domain-containing protein [Streptomyces sp. B1I3]MDQ0795640.1 hypothetical protein [Streptomyces sp. B1I3]